MKAYTLDLVFCTPY